MNRNSKAFTIAEMTLVVLFIAIMAVIAVPKLQFGSLHRQQADTIARGLVTDFRLTRILAINNAATNVDGFSLNMTGTEPYSGYDIINLDTDEVVESYTIPSEIQCTGGNDFRFGPLGNLLNGSDNQIDVSAAGRSFTITVVSANGAVRCVEN